jgi:hypothetical protein
MKSKIRIIGVVICLTASSAPVLSQTLSIEAGYGRHSELGTWSGNCGCDFSGGSGNGLVVSIGATTPLLPTLSVGGSVGIDYKQTTNSSHVFENAVVQTIQNSKEVVDTVALSVQRDLEIATTYITIAPAILYYPLEAGPFLRISPELSLLTSSHVSQTRRLQSTSGTLSDGSTVSNLRFTNGTTIEQLQAEPIEEANSLRYSLNLGAGYDISFGNIAISPMVIYDYPLNTISDKGAEDFKISSIYGVLGLKMKLR